MFFHCQKYLSVKNSSHQPNFFCYTYISLMYICEKYELFEGFTNDISLGLNKILFASLKNFILLVASHTVFYVQTKKINSQFLLKIVWKHHKNETKVDICLGCLPPEPMFRPYYNTFIFNTRRKYQQCLLQFYQNFRSFPMKLQGYCSLQYEIFKLLKKVLN